jgi:enterochelin esterase family protein
MLVVAIHAGDERIQEYGIADKPDFKKRGAKATFIPSLLKPNCCLYYRTYRYRAF